MSSEAFNFKAHQRRIRVVIILDAAERAGLVPLPLSQLHTIGYLVDVLSPAWHLPVIEGKVLKREDSPFYPALQQDIDRLLGMGVIAVENLTYELDHDGRWRLSGSYRPLEPVERVMNAVREFESEAKLVGFIRELVLALSALPDEQIRWAALQDAAYSDPSTDDDNVLDFGEWRSRNVSVNAARELQSLLPRGGRATQGEMLHMYVEHIHRRFQG